MLLKEKEDIIKWLEKYKVKNYTLISDETYGYVVDVADYVYLANKNLTEISVKFGAVSGYFDCDNNKLTSLQGSPQSVGGYFICSDNELISLSGSPNIIGGSFYCDSNQLTSLEGSPNTVGAGFYCDNNPALGKLQKMENLKEIKAYLMAEKLAMELPHDLDNQKNNRKIKL